MDPLQDAKNLSTGYQNLVEKLMTDLNAATSLAEIRILFSSFYLKYTMITALWKKWLEFEEKTTFSDFDASIFPKQKEKIKILAKSHFFHENFDEENLWMKGIFYRRVQVSAEIFGDAACRSLCKPTTAKPFEQALTFPHTSLALNKLVCKQYCTQPISPKILRQFNESKAFIAQLKKCINSNGWKIWCKTLIGHPDKNFILNTFEYRLGKYPHCWRSWQFYIEYLSTFNIKLALTVCSRYCRLFFGHHYNIFGFYIQMTIMMNIQFHNVSGWWIDIIEFQRTFESEEKARELLENIQKIHRYQDDEIFVNYVEWFEECPNKEDSPFFFSLPGMEIEMDYEETEKFPDIFHIEQKVRKPILHFTSDQQQNMKLPNFSIHFNYIYYMMKSANPVVLQRLFKSCKWFYLKQKNLRFCHRLGIYDDVQNSTFFEQSLFLNSNSLDFEGLKGLTVTNLLQIFSPLIPSATSQILSKLDISRIRFVDLHYQNLTETEFDAVSGVKIRAVSLSYCQIYNLENTKLKIEAIIKKFPNAKRMAMEYEEEYFTEKTAEELEKWEKQTKNIAYLYLSNVPQTFGDSFFEFLKKFATPRAFIRIKFGFDVDDNYKMEFQSNGNDALAGLNIFLEIL